MIRVVDDKKNMNGSKGYGGEVVKAIRAVSTPESRSVELLEKMKDPSEFNIHKAAYSRGMNVSTFLEALDPSKDHKDSGLDAFQRVLRAAEIRTATDHMNGVFADTLDAFDKTDSTRQLLPEWFARTYRAAVFGIDTRAAQYLSTDFITGGMQKPWAARTQVVKPPVQAAIPVSALVAITTGITGDSYRGFYINDDGAKSRRMRRIAEGAEIPRLKITAREQAIRIYKYGGAIEMSYESLRRLQIDMVALHIQMIAAQAEVDKVVDALDVLINGDGNDNAITTVNMSTLTSDFNANKLDLEAWLGFEMEFENPYAMDVVLAQKGPAKQVRLLNTGTANVVAAGAFPLGGIINNVRLINRTADGVALGWLSDAPANKLIGVDSGKALERVYEIGGSVSETERFILRQTEALTFTEVEGWGIIDAAARKALNMAA